MTRFARTAFAAIAFLFLASLIGCRPGARVAAAASAYTGGPGACEEGLLAARAWECLRSGNRGTP